ncbi:putative potassium transport system protein kup 2 [Labeo rohita]|uniref:Potassium transport system protein kup 2 n=1 Tax=Labeo rohita TaxID=84645 RepID=A0ABQ8M1D5_LABRO|nr:putative potassium transport system protein kup 2 [Labeo rohita]
MSQAYWESSSFTASIAEILKEAPFMIYRTKLQPTTKKKNPTSNPKQFIPYNEIMMLHKEIDTFMRSKIEEIILFACKTLALDNRDANSLQ